MRILLFDSPDLNESLAEPVRDFLAPFSGPWKFELLAGKTASPSYYEDEDFNPEKSIAMADFGMASEASFPRIERWSDIFIRVEKQRKKHRIADNDFMLLYTAERNELNWFGMFDPESRKPNGFVQGTYWEEYVQSESLYPILYQTIAIPLQWRMFKNAKNVGEVTHAQPIGCINDFCENKREIMLKLQTGNICQTCYDRAIEAGLSEAELDQIDVILDAIRLKFREFNQRRKKRDPYAVTIAKEGRKVYIGDSELRLRPLDKALYLFFLNAKQEYRTTDLADHERTLLEYYRPLFKGSENDEMIRNAGRLAVERDTLYNVVTPPDAA